MTGSRITANNTIQNQAETFIPEKFHQKKEDSLIISTVYWQYKSPPV